MTIVIYFHSISMYMTLLVSQNPSQQTTLPTKAQGSST